MNRRQFLARAAGASVVLPWAAEVRAQSKPAQIAVMTWGGQFGDVVRSGFDAVFEKKFGIKVVQDRGSSPVERITKVKINEANQIYDILQLHDGLVPLAVKQGAFERIDRTSPRLTNLPQVYPQFVTDHWVAFIFSELGVAYNTKLVKTPPRSFADLWRPEFKGRIVLPAITHSIGPYIIPIGAMAAGKSPKDEEAGFEMLKRITDLQPIWARDTDGIMNAIQNEEAVVGLLYRSQTFTLQGRGAPAEWVSPSEGAISVSWGAGIAKGTKNRPWAEEYLNAIMSAEGQTAFANAFNYSGANRGTADLLPADVRQRVSVNVADLDRLVHLDQEFMGDRRVPWTERWNRIVAS